MLLYLVTCDDCSAPRAGRKQGNAIRPIRDDCPVCGSSDYTVPTERVE